MEYTTLVVVLVSVAAIISLTIKESGVPHDDVRALSRLGINSSVAVHWTLD